MKSEINECICPIYDSCFIGNITRTIEVPSLIQYCRRDYRNCRYFSRSIQRGQYIDQRSKEAPLV